MQSELQAHLANSKTHYYGEQAPAGADPKDMTPELLISILSVAAKLKTTPRHCWTEPGRQESVADHTFRLALMAMLLSGEEAFSDVDVNRVIRMCLIHDLGEAFTGDIPAFLKEGSDEKAEEEIFGRWIGTFPQPQKDEWVELLGEMEALETKEARTYKALDKLEALISHNESDIATWLPLEYDLQMTYGQENMKFSEYFIKLREYVDAWTLRKIKEAKDEKGADHDEHDTGAENQAGVQ